MLGRYGVAVSRKFVDSDGVHWQVYQLAAGDGGDDGALAHDGWLYFFSRGVTRSLAPYPDDWSQMDWPGLEQLCRRARPPIKAHPFQSRLASRAAATRM